MENNQKDFMKNRPVVSGVNQIKDVYGSQKASTRTVLTVVFAVLMVVFSVLSVIGGKSYLLSIFLPVLAALILSAALSRGKEKMPPSDGPENSETIFKDHDV